MILLLPMLNKWVDCLFAAQQSPNFLCVHLWGPSKCKATEAQPIPNAGWDCKYKERKSDEGWFFVLPIPGICCPLQVPSHKQGMVAQAILGRARHTRDKREWIGKNK